LIDLAGYPLPHLDEPLPSSRPVSVSTRRLTLCLARCLPGAGRSRRCALWPTPRRGSE
jgi:hypothetical protein